MGKAGEEQAGVVRRIIVLAAALAAMLAVAAPAHAAAARVVSPEDGATLDEGPHDIEVEVFHLPLEPHADEVVARLVLGDDTTATATLRCVSDCDRLEQRWARSFDPTTGEPFSGRPLPNGPARIEVAVDGGDFEPGPTVTMSVPPSPPREVRAVADGRDVAVTWQRAPEPDISSYRIQRRPAGGPWEPAGQVPGDTDQLTDPEREPGDYAYRVVSVRPDGDDGTYTAVSDPSAVTVRAPGPSAGDAPDGSSSPTSDGSPSESGASLRPGDSSGGAEPETTDSGSASSDELTLGDLAAPSSREEPQPSARAAPPDVAASDEQFYGEDEPFSQELGFDDADLAGPTPDPISQTEIVRIPGGSATSTSRVLDPDRIATPLAGGLLLIATGLHLRQWQARGRSYLWAR